MSDRPSGNPNFEAHGRGVPVVAAPAVEHAVDLAPAPHPADVEHLGRVQHSPAPTGWSPTAWRKHRAETK